MTEKLLGFDVRVSQLNGLPTLTRGVETGASSYHGVDHTCWSAPEEFEGIQGAIIDKDTWRGPNSYLWENLDELNRYVAQLVLPTNSLLDVIAITIVPELGLLEIPELPRIGRNYIHLDSTTPSDIDPKWEKLGYDVAENFLLSPLCSIGGVFTSSKYLEPLFNNSQGLYFDFIVADKARLHANTSCPEHAPFFVYGIYKVANIAS